MDGSTVFPSPSSATRGTRGRSRRLQAHSNILAMNGGDGCPPLCHSGRLVQVHRRTANMPSEGKLSLLIHSGPSGDSRGAGTVLLQCWSNSTATASQQPLQGFSPLPAIWDGQEGSTSVQVHSSTLALDGGVVSPSPATRSGRWTRAQPIRLRGGSLFLQPLGAPWGGATGLLKVHHRTAAAA